jgi:hypothetical protein
MIICHSGEGQNPVAFLCVSVKILRPIIYWIPAYAGMTKGLDFSFDHELGQVVQGAA